MESDRTGTPVFCLGEITMDKIEPQEKRPKRYVKTMTVLTPSLLTRLDAEAGRRTASRSLLIRQACEKMLQEAEQAEQGGCNNG